MQLKNTATNRISNPKEIRDYQECLSLQIIPNFVCYACGGLHSVHCKEGVTIQASMYVWQKVCFRFLYAAQKAVLLRTPPGEIVNAQPSDAPQSVIYPAPILYNSLIIIGMPVIKKKQQIIEPKMIKTHFPSNLHNRFHTPYNFSNRSSLAALRKKRTHNCSASLFPNKSKTPKLLSIFLNWRAALQYIFLLCA